MTDTTHPSHDKRYEFFYPHDADQPKFAANSLGAIQGCTGIVVSDLKKRCKTPYPRGKVVCNWRIVDLKPTKKHNCYSTGDKAIRVQQMPVNEE